MKVENNELKIIDVSMNDLQQQVTKPMECIGTYLGICFYSPGLQLLSQQA